MQYDEDTTLHELERRAAYIIGKESAIFVPTGVMGNQVCLMYHASKFPRGSELVCADECHLVQYEAGVSAWLAGFQTRAVRTGDGILTRDLVLSNIRL